MHVRILADRCVLWLNDTSMILPQKMSEKVNRKWPPSNTTVQLSTSTLTLRTTIPECHGQTDIRQYHAKPITNRSLLHAVRLAENKKV